MCLLIFYCNYDINITYSSLKAMINFDRPRYRGEKNLVVGKREFLFGSFVLSDPESGNWFGFGLGFEVTWMHVKVGPRWCWWNWLHSISSFWWKRFYGINPFASNYQLRCWSVWYCPHLIWLFIISKGYLTLLIRYFTIYKKYPDKPPESNQ